MTSRTSIPPRTEQRLAISFENDMRYARSAFEAYLIISAVRGGKRPVHFFEGVESPCVVPAQHNAVREHKVVDGFAFREEFRVHTYTKIHPCPFAGSGFKSGNHMQVGGSGDNGALHHHNMISGLVTQRGTDLPRRSHHRGQVNRSTIQRRADSDESKFRIGDCSRK